MRSSLLFSPSHEKGRPTRTPWRGQQVNHNNDELRDSPDRHWSNAGINIFKGCKNRKAERIFVDDLYPEGIDTTNSLGVKLVVF